MTKDKFYPQRNLNVHPNTFLALVAAKDVFLKWGTTKTIMMPNLLHLLYFMFDHTTYPVTLQKLVVQFNCYKDHVTKQYVFDHKAPIQPLQEEFEMLQKRNRALNEILDSPDTIDPRQPKYSAVARKLCGLSLTRTERNTWDQGHYQVMSQDIQAAVATCK